MLGSTSRFGHLDWRRDKREMVCRHARAPRGDGACTASRIVAGQRVHLWAGWENPRNRRARSRPFSAFGNYARSAFRGCGDKPNHDHHRLESFGRDLHQFLAVDRYYRQRPFMVVSFRDGDSDGNCNHTPDGAGHPAECNGNNAKMAPPRRRRPFQSSILFRVCLA